LWHQINGNSEFRCAQNRSLPWVVNQVVSIRTTSTSVSGISVFPSADTDQIIFLGFPVVPVFTHSINTVYRNQTSSVFTRTPCFKQEVYNRLCLRSLLRKQ
ncbi:hypothetical protein T07_15054, partial [Trichinella nelsoni]